MPLQILIADDHGVLRAGLASLLSGEADLEVVGEAENAEQAIKMALSLRPDIVLMDISLPDIDGIEATRKIKEACQGVQVLILTVHEDNSLLMEALKSGASGYMLKRAVKKELLEAIHAVAGGGIYIHSIMAHALIPTPTIVEQQPAASATDELTHRELEVLRLIVQGYTNSQVAQQLCLSVRTVEYHRCNLMAKLKITSRVELMRYAQEHNLF